MSTESSDGFWAVVELMGHVKMAGFVTEEERFGAKLGRIDIPAGDEGEDPFTQYFGGSSIYRVTPITEDKARLLAVSWRPRPITAYDLRTVPQLSNVNHVMFDDDERVFDDDEY